MIRSKLLYAVLLVVLVLFYYLYRGDPERGAVDRRRKTDCSQFPA